ncbi:MAG: hypothetical protein GX295_07740 [Syntrophomonadaceae bacterium]|nr:hypothetical protein [Syntrophomonadaceae bacterium]
MKKYLRVMCLVILVGAVMGLGGCSKSEEAANTPPAKTNLKMATNANFQPVVDAMIPLMKAKGYTIELLTFDDPLSINVATQEGSVDVNFYQHLPYLNKFNSSKNGTLVMVQLYLLVSKMGLFSNKHKSTDALPEGATIAIAMDAANKDRGLRMLRDNGLLTLAETPASGAYTLVDIIDNPKKFKFVEVDLYQLLRTLDDVDAGAINASYLIAAGKDLSSGICFSKDDDTFPCGVVVREDNKDTQWIKDLMECITSDECRNVAKEYYKGSFRILF